MARDVGKYVYINFTSWLNILKFHKPLFGLFIQCSCTMCVCMREKFPLDLLLWLVLLLRRDEEKRKLTLNILKFLTSVFDDGLLCVLQENFLIQVNYVFVCVCKKVFFENLIECADQMEAIKEEVLLYFVLKQQN